MVFRLRRSWLYAGLIVLFFGFSFSGQQATALCRWYYSSKIHESNGLPRVTGLQYLVLIKIPPNSTIRGEDLREALRLWIGNRSLVSFYQLMQRLEEAGWIESERVTGTREVPSHKIYTITEEGIDAINYTESWYSSP